MRAPPQPRTDPSGRLLVLLLVTVMGGFVFASLLAQQTSAQVASLSETLASTSSPSVERLAHLRSSVFQVELNLSEYLRTASSAEGGRRGFEASLDSLARATKAYLDLPLLPGEKPYWGETQASLIRFEASVRSTAELARSGDVSAARREYSADVRQAGERLVQSSLSGIEFHAQRSREIANQIKEVRWRSLVLGDVLSGACVTLGVMGLFLVLRQFRRHRALVEAHARFHETRANELEQFAGRVAHDIRNPLSAASMAAHLGLRLTEDGGLKDLLVRIVRSLSRADAITTALLEFARSGAQPEPGARATPSEVLNDVLREISPDAEQQRIEIQVQPVPPVMVACSSGVYWSVLSNLVRNAIKYMGDAATRRISVRVSIEGNEVRTEVADTGPGIASDSLGSLFEPYFRLGRDRAKEGLGLGLATVKKLVEGHHGAVGVSSEPGAGSTFWFTLPRAGSSETFDGGSDEHAEHADDRPRVHH